MSLKRALDRPDSPLRRFVDARLPHGDDARAPWGAALRQVRPVPFPKPPAGEDVPTAAIGHALRARVLWEFVPLDQLALSPQCGFASTEEGNILSEEEQWAKLRLAVEIASEVWGK